LPLAWRDNTRFHISSFVKLKGRRTAPKPSCDRRLRATVPYSDRCDFRARTRHVLRTTAGRTSVMGGRRIPISATGNGPAERTATRPDQALRPVIRRPIGPTKSANKCEIVREPRTQEHAPGQIIEKNWAVRSVRHAGDRQSMRLKFLRFYRIFKELVGGAGALFYAIARPFSRPFDESAHEAQLELLAIWPSPSKSTARADDNGDHAFWGGPR